MADPTIEAARVTFDDSLGELRGVVAGSTAAELDRRPGADDTNSIAVLTVHALSSARWWLSLAMGAPPPERDRASEFLAVTTSTDDLLSFVDEMAEDCRSLLDAGGSFEPAAVCVNGSEEVTAIWALIHALEHLREHVGHAQLTSQLFLRHG